MNNCYCVILKKIVLYNRRVPKMIYTCKKCLFMFDRVGLVERCPDCGSENFRPSTKEEKEEFENYQREFNKKKADKLA